MLPLFSPHEGAVHEALRKIEPAALLEIFGQRAKDPVEHPFLAPSPKAAVTGLVGRIAFRQIAPGRACTQDPQDTIEHVSGVPPRPSFAVRPARRIWD
jgi:hypothetical protein